MRKLSLMVGLMLFASVALVHAEEREGQDPDPPGANALPGAAQKGKRVGEDPDVPGGAVPGTPGSKGGLERMGNDPDVPVEGGEVR